MTESHPPPPPEGYDTPTPFPRPRWRLEALGLGLLVVLAVGTGLHERFFAISDVTRLVVVLVILAMVVCHEGCHYAASRAMGFDPVVEVLPPRIYSTDRWSPRSEGIVHLLAPFVVLNAVGVLLWTGPTPERLSLVGHVIVVVNTAVSGADLYAVGYLLAKPRGTVTIVVRADDAPREFVAEPASRSDSTDSFQ